MIPAIRFIWKQLNGPQITAIMQAAFEWIKLKCNDLIKYYWNLSITTANEQHVTLFGVLVGFQRPIVTRVNRDYFFFTELPPTLGSMQGYSYRPGPPIWGPDPLEWGGRFSDLDAVTESIREFVDFNWYKVLLLEYVESKGQMASLEMLNDILVALSEYDNAERVPYFVMKFIDEWSAMTGPGDIQLYLDHPTVWKHGVDAYELVAALNSSIYAPSPNINIIFRGIAATSLSEDLSEKCLQFLNKEQLLVKEIINIRDTVVTAEEVPTPSAGCAWNTKPDGSGETFASPYTLNKSYIEHYYEVDVLRIDPKYLEVGVVLNQGLQRIEVPVETVIPDLDIDIDLVHAECVRASHDKTKKCIVIESRIYGEAEVVLGVLGAKVSIPVKVNKLFGWRSGGADSVYRAISEQEFLREATAWWHADNSIMPTWYWSPVDGITLRQTQHMHTTNEKQVTVLHMDPQYPPGVNGTDTGIHLQPIQDGKASGTMRSGYLDYYALEIHPAPLSIKIATFLFAYDDDGRPCWVRYKTADTPWGGTLIMEAATTPPPADLMDHSNANIARLLCAALGVQYDPSRPSEEVIAECEKHPNWTEDLNEQCIIQGLTDAVMDARRDPKHTYTMPVIKSITTK